MLAYWIVVITIVSFILGYLFSDITKNSANENKINKENIDKNIDKNTTCKKPSTSDMILAYYMLGKHVSRETFLEVKNRETRLRRKYNIIPRTYFNYFIYQQLTSDYPRLEIVLRELFWIYNRKITFNVSEYLQSLKHLPVKTALQEFENLATMGYYKNCNKNSDKSSDKIHEIKFHKSNFWVEVKT